MSKVENLEFDPAYWRLQIGIRVEDLEKHPLVIFPQQVPVNPNPAPIQILAPAFVPSVPAQNPVSYFDQHSIQVPVLQIAPPLVPSSVAFFNGPRNDPLLDTLSLQDPNSLRGSANTSISSVKPPASLHSVNSNSDQTQLERLQNLILPELIPKQEECSELSSHPSRDQEQLDRLEHLILPEILPEEITSRDPLETYRHFDL